MRAQTGNIFIYKTNLPEPPAFRSGAYYEILYVMEGFPLVTVQRDTFILKPGDFCLIQPRAKHSTEFPVLSSVTYIGIAPGMFDKILQNTSPYFNIISALFQKRSPQAKKQDYLIFLPKKGDPLQGHVHAMLQEYEKQFPQAEKALCGMLSALFSRLLQDYEYTASMSPVTNRHIIQSFNLLSFIQENYQDISLEKISLHFHLTVPYCSRLIKEFTGKSFSWYLRNIRMERAQYLLRNTNLPVSEISTAVGFANPEHFIRTFKLIYKITPGKYRIKAGKPEEACPRSNS